MKNNKIVVGAMLVSQSESLLELSIINLLKHCDWLVVIMDNQSKEVEEKVYELQKKYYNKIFVRLSSIPSRIFTRRGNLLNYRQRWKSCKGIIRHGVFSILKDILALDIPNYNKIDILLWPDHDIIFSDYLPMLLNDFIISDKKAISMKHIEVVGDMNTIMASSIGHHVHIMKYSSDLAGLPRRFFALYHPLCVSDLMFSDYYSVHLAYLTEENRKWREDNWKRDVSINTKTYQIPCSAEKFDPSKINGILK